MENEEELLCDEISINDTSLGGHGDGTNEGANSEMEREEPLHASQTQGLLYTNLIALQTHSRSRADSSKIKRKMQSLTSLTVTMNGTIARRVFSASTAVLSSTALRRSTLLSRPFPSPIRPYSSQKSQQEDAAESTPEPGNAEVSVESQVLENLKKKEEEVHDLTVSLSPSSDYSCSPCSRRVDYGIYRPTF